MGELKVKRIFLPPEAPDGRRILVDRLWPRGISKEMAALDEWAKDAAPTSALRKWFGHDPKRFEEFAFLYRKELNENPTASELAARCWERLETENVTLLYAAQSDTCNHAIVLKEWLLQKMPLG